MIDILIRCSLIEEELYQFKHLEVLLYTLLSFKIIFLCNVMCICVQTANRCENEIDYHLSAKN